MKYKKKPVVIEAVQYDGNFRCLDIFSINEVGKFEVAKEDDGSPYLLIPTLEGKMKSYLNPPNKKPYIQKNKQRN
jgi:hypothetical protein